MLTLSTQSMGTTNVGQLQEGGASVDHPGKSGRGPRWSAVAKKGLELPGAAAQAFDPGTWKARGC